MQTNQTFARYAVDVAFCIDCTASMGPYLDSVKATAATFHTRLQAEMERQGKDIAQLRVKVVIFRDLGVEGEDAIQETRFFLLPDEANTFAEAMSSLRAFGGGDEPESALEALTVAIRADWERALDRRRHIVVMCTDASAHPLGKFPAPGHDEQRPMPASLEELQAIWGDEIDEGEMDYAAKRLLIFAPDVYPWADATGLFENCIYVPTVGTSGLSDQDQNAVISKIAGSV